MKILAMKRIFAFSLLICLALSGLNAQVSTGSVSGSVTDPNGALVPSAKVEAKEETTGRTYETTTTDAGFYVLPSLPVGGYTVAVERTGFKKSVQSGIVVRVATRQTLDVRLEVGDIQQAVSVRAELPLLETVTPERGQSLSDGRVLAGPIGAEESHVRVRESLLDLGSAQGHALVHLARQAPAGGEVHKGRPARGKSALDGIGGPGLPRTSGGRGACGRGSSSRAFRCELASEEHNSDDREQKKRSNDRGPAPCRPAAQKPSGDGDEKQREQQSPEHVGSVSLCEHPR